MKFLPSILLSLAAVSIAGTCNIPVFRYALERWKPDPVEWIVFHDGALTADQEVLVEGVSTDSRGGLRRVNVQTIRSDLSQPSAAQLDLWQTLEADGEATLPYVVVRARLGPNRFVNGWRGPLDAFRQANVFDSPAREELSQRLLKGHSIVWLIIGSDDDQRTEAASRMLAGQFEELAKKVQLPSGIGLPGSELHSEVPLLLRFSLIEVDRSDPREQFLVQFLSGFQPEAFDAGEPLIVPVFGRGRALEVIPASVVNPQLIEDLTLFLSGACSCQVKEQNPGFDLLLSADWDRELFGEGVRPPAAEPAGARREPTLLSIPTGRNDHE